MQPSQMLEPADFFVMRTPLLPFDAFQAWGEQVAAPPAQPEPALLAQPVTADRQQLRDYLHRTLTEPAVREAIFLASPDLAAGFERWVQAPESERGQRAERALVRYFARMAGRATPFGLFSGCSLGKIGQGATQLTLAPRAAYQRHTRLDMDYLFALTETLGGDPAVQRTLCYRPNSSLYAVANRLRYAEARLNGKMRTYHLVAVERTDYLEATLRRAENGALLAGLSEALVADDPEITLQEAESYVGELIASQLLVANLAPAVTGAEPIHGLIDQLLRQPITQGIAQPLAATRDALQQMDADGLGVDPMRYHAIAHSLAELPTKVELARLFQVDMVKPVRAANVGPQVIQAIKQGMDILYHFNAHNTENMAQFIKAFTQRYETREVALTAVLDEESGIGFGPTTGSVGGESAPLLAGLLLPATGGATTTPWGRIQLLLLRKLEEAQRAGAEQIELTPADLAAVTVQGAPPLPNALAVMATVVAPSQAAMDAGHFQVVLEGASGPSGARLLGRFCHADPNLHQAVEQYLQAEEALEPDAVFAEIVHLPEGRVGNVICRPVLREYEIPFLGQSGATPDKQIALTDLYVSIVNGQVILRSKRLNRRVIPRLSTAHNFVWRSLSVYKFLCALQHQGVVAGLGWEWGALEQTKFLPRVTSGRVVLARARWLISQEEIRQLHKLEDAALMQAIQAWRAERRLPRLVLLADADNQLPVDLDNLLSVESLIDVVKGRQQITLVEMLPSPAELCAEGPEGRFVHELVIPFIRRREEKTRGGATTPNALHASPTCLPVRRFAPGSEWLYLKLYTGAATADQVLREVIRPVVNAANTAGIIDQWFFLRYGDPDWHVRVRFHSPGAAGGQRLAGELLPMLQRYMAPLLEEGRIWRVQLDTYEREIERYGGATGILLAEQLFHIDSEATAAIIDLLDGDQGEEARWRLALRSIDQFLADLGFDLPAKQQLMRGMRDSFAQEFQVENSVRKQLSDKFRPERKILEILLDSRQDAASPLAPGLAILRQRSSRCAPVVAALKNSETADQLALTLPALAPSYIHMQVNRLLRSAQRAHELVLYDFLDRLYTSQMARTAPA